MADVEVGPETSGGTVSAHPGDLVVVRLPENPTTGYRWAVEEQGAGLSLVDTAFQPPLAAVPGAGGERSFRFRVEAPGTVTVTLHSRRAGGAATTTFSLTVSAL